MTLLHGDFTFFVPPRYRSFPDFLSSRNSKGFVCGWGYDLLEIVYCFVNPGWIEFRFSFFLSELKRYVFLVNWPVFFSYMPLQFWVVVLLSPYVIFMGKCSLSYGSFKVSHFRCWAICGLEKVKSIALVLPFLVLKCVGEPVFSKIKSWLLSRFSIVFPLLSILVDPQRVWWLLKSSDRISGAGSWAIKSSRSYNWRGKLLGM